MGRWGVGAIALVLGTSVAACDSDDQAHTTTTSTSIEGTSTSPTAALNCAAHLPDGFTSVVSEEPVTVADVRAIVVGTLPPEPTQLLLPSHAADDLALFCIASDGGNSYNSYWVASDDEVETVCITSYAGGLPAEPTWGCE